MSQRYKLYVSTEEDGCFGWVVRDSQHRRCQSFGASIIERDGLRYISNFLWYAPLPPTLAALRDLLAREGEDQHVARIRIKPDAEVRYQRIIARMPVIFRSRPATVPSYEQFLKEEAVRVRLRDERWKRDAELRRQNADFRRIPEGSLVNAELYNPDGEMEDDNT